MFSQNPRADRFITKLPLNFFDASINEKYNNYIKLQNSFLTSIQQVVNESITHVSIPGLEQQLTAQATFVGNDGGAQRDITYYGGNNPLEEVMESNIITFTFRHLDSYINYFYLMELFYKKYITKDKTIRFTIPVTVLSIQKFPVFTVYLEKCIFKAIQGIDLAYESTTRDFKDFTCSFQFSDFNVEFDLPQGTAKQYIKS